MSMSRNYPLLPLPLPLLPPETPHICFLHTRCEPTGTHLRGPPPRHIVGWSGARVRALLGLSAAERQICRLLAFSTCSTAGSGKLQRCSTSASAQRQRGGTRPCPAVRLRGNGGNDSEKQGIRNHDTEQHCPRQPVGTVLLLCPMEERLARLETLVEQ